MIVGGMVTIVSLVAGFAAMFTGAQDAAKIFLTLIPVGFLMLFAGLVTVVLSGPAKGHMPDDTDERL